MKETPQTHSALGYKTPIEVFKKRGRLTQENMQHYNSPKWEHIQVCGAEDVFQGQKSFLNRYFGRTFLEIQSFPTEVKISAPMDINDNYYFTTLAAAFVRGRLIQRAMSGSNCQNIPPINEQDKIKLIKTGIALNLRLHKFKRTMGLKRVEKVLGILRGIWPENILDIGSGRGAALWPMWEAFPDISIVSIDINWQRIPDIHQIHIGGISYIIALQADATSLPFKKHSFDVITMLEVLEHIEDTLAVVKELIRVARRFIVISVPSKKDNNPKHIHHFRPDEIQNLFLENGAKRVTVDFVLNHLIGVISV